MDELVRHCLRELSFDGDLGEWTRFTAHVIAKRDALCPQDTLVQGFEPRPVVIFRDPHLEIHVFDQGSSRYMIY